MKPKVSIITASHMRPDFLRRSIVAIQNQVFKEYEHIVVADHCPLSEKVYEEYKSDPRLVFSTTDGEHVWNRGGTSKNKGIQIARGDYICYCDDDNILLPNHVEFLYNKIVEEQADICFSSMHHIQRISHFEKFIRQKNYMRILKSGMFDITASDGTNVKDMLTCIHKKELKDQLHVWPIRQDLPHGESEDGHMMNRFASDNHDLKVVHYDKKTCIYNAHKGMGTFDAYYDLKAKALAADVGPNLFYKNQIYVYPDIKPKF